VGPPFTTLIFGHPPVGWLEELLFALEEDLAEEEVGGTGLVEEEAGLVEEEAGLGGLGFSQVGLQFKVIQSL